MNWREFQAREKIAKIGERFISYIDEGSGAPLVLIHGIPTWSFLWHGLIPSFAKEYRVLAPDLPGFGYSDKSDRFDRSIARQAEFVDAWMEKIGLQSAHVIAHDIGGGVALRLSTLFSARVKKLVLLNTVSYDSWPIEAMLQFGHPETRRKTSADAAARMLKQALKGGFTHGPEDELLDGLIQPYTTEVGKLSLIRNAAALNTNLTMELTHLLPKVSVPTLILWGEDDQFQLVKFGARLADDIPGARLVRIKDARHFVMFDKPDEVQTQVLAFVGGG